MSVVLDKVTEAQDQLLTAIETVKEPATDAVAVAVALFLERVPSVPAVPFAEKLPTPKQLIDNQAKFATKLVSTNKALALSVASAAQPLTDQLLDRTTPARPSKPAARTTKATKAA